MAVAVTDGEEFGEDSNRAGNVAAVDTEEEEVACHCVDGVDVEERRRNRNQYLQCHPSKQRNCHHHHLHGRKGCTMVAKGVQKTLSKTSLLADFLPAGNLLTFKTLIPIVYRCGGSECTHVTTLMITALLPLCMLSCFFFHFTDSFACWTGGSTTGSSHPTGWPCSSPVSKCKCLIKEERYRLGLSDFVLASMSAMVFLAIAFSDCRSRVVYSRVMRRRWMRLWKSFL
ncbi:hypothetical protein RHSIM_Rhsim09G0129200 [Rhododendron simsii]|uniref:Uncharacterized protein n=1 Tax=Rhododendron simsii TaxID=118357 RepID=A0A834LF57_RHOSS|nr:hypothetical protein RHSIM_Rhsim09G0129200 [Rhododendron simsii]